MPSKSKCVNPEPSPENLAADNVPSLGLYFKVPATDFKIVPLRYGIAWAVLSPLGLLSFVTVTFVAVPVNVVAVILL